MSEDGREKIRRHWDKLTPTQRENVIDVIDGMMVHGKKARDMTDAQLSSAMINDVNGEMDWGTWESAVTSEMDDRFQAYGEALKEAGMDCKEIFERFLERQAKQDEKEIAARQKERDAKKNG